MMWEKDNKRSDYQPLKLTNSELKLVSTKWPTNKCKKNSLRLEARKMLIIKTKSLCSLNKLKDWTVSSRKRTRKFLTCRKKCSKSMRWINQLETYRLRLPGWSLKTHPFKTRWEMPKRTLDYQLIKTQKWWKIFLSTRKLLIRTIRKMKELSKEWKN